MLTEIYIEALLVDASLADHVWEAWDEGLMNDAGTCIAWLKIVESDSAADRDMTSAGTPRGGSRFYIDLLGPRVSGPKKIIV